MCTLGVADRDDADAEEVEVLEAEVELDVLTEAVEAEALVGIRRPSAHPDRLTVLDREGGGWGRGEKNSACVTGPGWKTKREEEKKEKWKKTKREVY